MTRIEAIRQRAGVLWESYLRDDHYNHQDIAVELADFVPELVTLWDTRETALRALVEQWKQNAEASIETGYYARQDKTETYDRCADALSRLLEQEPKETP